MSGGVGSVTTQQSESVQSTGSESKAVNGYICHNFLLSILSLLLQADFVAISCAFNVYVWM